MFQAILEALLPFLKQAQQQKRSQNSILLRINLNSIATTLQFFPSNVTPLQQYYNFFPAVYIHYNNTTIFSQQCNSITKTLQFFSQQCNSITTTLQFFSSNVTPLQQHNNFFFVKLKLGQKNENKKFKFPMLK